MIERKIDHLDLSQVAESGQCFRWKKIEDKKYSVIAYDRLLTIEDVSVDLSKEKIFRLDCTKAEWDNIWSHYLDMDTDYMKVERLIRNSNDTHLLDAYEKGSGIRILKQDLFEMLVSYIISQNNNIPRIKGSIEAICKKGGFVVEKATTESLFKENDSLNSKCVSSEGKDGLSDKDEMDYFRLPKPFEVDDDFFDDKTLGLGYRVGYLKDLFSFLRHNPYWLTELEEMDYEHAREALLQRKGIGPKVADCICLFALHHVEAFPIDTHVKQLLMKYYPDGFDYDYYEGFAGIIQQYLFFFELNDKNR